MSANGSVFHHRAQSQGTGKQNKTKNNNNKSILLAFLTVCRSSCLFHFPSDVFLSGCFLSDASSAMTTRTKTKRKTCVSGKGRLVNDKCYSNVTVTVILLDRVVFVLSGYHLTHSVSQILTVFYVQDV